MVGVCEVTAKPVAKKPVPKRKISNEEYRDAYSDRNNLGIIGRVTSSYRRQLPPDELESCGMLGLWKALQCHDYNHKSGQKFTTTLFFFVRNECRHSLRKNKRWQNRTELLELPEIPVDGLPQHVAECLSLLPADARRLLDQYYCQELTLQQVACRNLISIETARVQIQRALSKLKSVVGSQ